MIHGHLRRLLGRDLLGWFTGTAGCCARAASGHAAAAPPMSVMNSRRFVLVRAVKNDWVH